MQAGAVGSDIPRLNIFVAQDVLCPTSHIFVTTHNSQRQFVFN